MNQKMLRLKKPETAYDIFAQEVHLFVIFQLYVPKEKYPNLSFLLISGLL